MKYFIVLVMAIISASWDRWMGEFLFFSFPIISLYTSKFLDNQIYKVLLGLIFTIIYFSTRFSLGFFSIAFFICYILIIEIASFLGTKYLSTLFFSGALALFLSFINYSLFSFVSTIILVSILYFINLRLMFYEK
jgi:hypothetical protein